MNNDYINAILVAIGMALVFIFFDRVGLVVDGTYVSLLIVLFILILLGLRKTT